MDQYFLRIKKLSENDQLPSRVRFRLLDIIDMRQREWRSRRQVAGPRPVSEIRAEFGSDLDPSLLLKEPTEEKPKTPKPSQSGFFAPRSAASTTPPIGGVGAGSNGSTTEIIESGESGGSLSRITKAFVGSVEKAKNGETGKYQPPRRSAAPPMNPYQDHHHSPVKKEKSAEAKKAFMPAFIKDNPTNQGHVHQSTNGGARFTALGKTGRIQARSGLPGQSGMTAAPSPFDRINKDRQMHQNKTRQMHQRRESPTHSPSRDFGSNGRNGYENGFSSGGSDNHRISPHRRSPSFDSNRQGYQNGSSYNRNHGRDPFANHSGNGFGGRHSPTTTRSPLARAESPRAPTQILNRPVQKKPEIDPNKGMGSF